jgi:small subunit ribosomal protein S8
MSMTDPVADMLTRIRNAGMAGHTSVEMPCSKLKVEIAKVLKDEGFIDAWKQVESSPRDLLKLYLKYDDYGMKIIRGIKRISTPGRRVYKQAGEMKPVLANTGIAVVSTSKGVMSDRECRRQKVGGEVLCMIW